MKLTRRSTLALLAESVTRPALAGENPVFAKGGIAIDGYDPVAYFTADDTVLGFADHMVEWNGAKWLFSNEKNKILFEEASEKLAPQYGGYCAYAVSGGYTAPTQPDTWTIYEGKLYLNYSQAARQLWSQDIPGHISSADGNWPKVLQ